MAKNFIDNPSLCGNKNYINISNSTHCIYCGDDDKHIGHYNPEHDGISDDIFSASTIESAVLVGTESGVSTCTVPDYVHIGEAKFKVGYKIISNYFVLIYTSDGEGELPSNPGIYTIDVNITSHGDKSGNIDPGSSLLTIPVLFSYTGINGVRHFRVTNIGLSDIGTDGALTVYNHFLTNSTYELSLEGTRTIKNAGGFSFNFHTNSMVGTESPTIGALVGRNGLIYNYTPNCVPKGSLVLCVKGNTCMPTNLRYEGIDIRYDTLIFSHVSIACIINALREAGTFDYNIEYLNYDLYYCALGMCAISDDTWCSIMSIIGLIPSYVKIIKTSKQWELRVFDVLIGTADFCVSYDVDSIPPSSGWVSFDEKPSILCWGACSFIYSDNIYDFKGSSYSGDEVISYYQSRSVPAMKYDVWDTSYFSPTVRHGGSIVSFNPKTNKYYIGLVYHGDTTETLIDGSKISKLYGVSMLYYPVTGGVEYPHYVTKYKDVLFNVVRADSLKHTIHSDYRIYSPFSMFVKGSNNECFNIAECHDEAALMSTDMRKSRMPVPYKYGIIYSFDVRVHYKITERFIYNSCTLSNYVNDRSTVSRAIEDTTYKLDVNYSDNNIPCYLSQHSPGMVNYVISNGREGIEYAFALCPYDVPSIEVIAEYYDLYEVTDNDYRRKEETKCPIIQSNIALDDCVYALLIQAVFFVGANLDTKSQYDTMYSTNITSYLETSIRYHDNTNGIEFNGITTIYKKDYDDVVGSTTTRDFQKYVNQGYDDISVVGIPTNPRSIDMKHGIKLLADIDINTKINDSLWIDIADYIEYRTARPYRYTGVIYLYKDATLSYVMGADGSLVKLDYSDYPNYDPVRLTEFVDTSNTFNVPSVLKYSVEFNNSESLSHKIHKDSTGKYFSDAFFRHDNKTYKISTLLHTSSWSTDDPLDITLDSVTPVEHTGDIPNPCSFIELVKYSDMINHIDTINEKIRKEDLSDVTPGTEHHMSVSGHIYTVENIKEETP